MMCSFLLISLACATVESNRDKQPAFLPLLNDDVLAVLPASSNNGMSSMEGNDAAEEGNINGELDSLSNEGEFHSGNKLDKLDDSIMEISPDALADISVAESQTHDEYVEFDTEVATAFKDDSSLIEVLPAGKENYEESDSGIDALEDAEEQRYVTEENPSDAEDVSVHEPPLFVEEMRYANGILSPCLRQNGYLSAFVTKKLSVVYTNEHNEDAKVSSPSMTCSITVTTTPPMVFTLEFWGHSSVACSFRNYVTISAGDKNMTWYHSCDVQAVPDFKSSGSSVTLTIRVEHSLSGHGFTINVVAVAGGLDLVHLSPTQGTMFCYLFMSLNGLAFHHQPAPKEG